jgi:catechol 2,3-dioxygenase-like lactoylglutathione lyase family enzyme
MQVTSVSIHAPDPRALAAFYRELLGWTQTAEDGPQPGAPPEDGWAQLRPPPGETGPTLNFEYEREYVPPVWPSVNGQQQTMTHVDIYVDDLDAAVAWATERGARVAGYQPQEDVRVMLDPADHPFCLFT